MRTQRIFAALLVALTLAALGSIAPLHPMEYG